MENTSTASLDTSVLIRIITGDLPEASARAERLLALGQRFFIPDLAFYEAAYVLEKNYLWPRRSIATAFSSIFISQKNIDCNKSLLYQVLEDYVLHQKLSFADCYLAWKSRLAAASPLYTFDRQLASQLPAVELV